MIFIKYIRLNNLLKYIVFFLLLTVTKELAGQDIPQSQTLYMTLANFRSKLPDSIDIDKLNYIIRGNDTLVPYKRTYDKDKFERHKYILKDTTFISLYKEIAFRALKGENSKHRYWDEEIKLFFGKSVPKKHIRYLLSFIKKNLKEVENLNVSRTNKVEDSNFIIYYQGDFEYEGRFVNNLDKPCEYYSYWTRNTINRVSLKITPEYYANEKFLLSELLRNFIINLGYFNKLSTLDCSSIFSDCPEIITELSLLDREILKYHYSYYFCVGMDLKFFEEQNLMAREFYRVNPDSDYFVLYRRND